jgi:hypothetical protein
VLLVVVVPLYGALANRIAPSALVQYVFLFFVACLLAFFGLGRAGVHVGFAFFVWLGIFATMSIAQFWSLANDLLTEAEGERLFPLIAIGGTLGAIAGAQVAARGIGSVGPFGLMLVAALLVVGCMICTSSGARAWRASGDSTVALWPLPGLLAVVKVVENGTEYSLQKRCSRPCSCRPRATPSTREKRRSTPSWCAPATWDRRRSSTSVRSWRSACRGSPWRTC